MGKMYKRPFIFSFIVLAMMLSIIAPNMVEADSIKTKAETAIIVDARTPPMPTFTADLPCQNYCSQQYSLWGGAFSSRYR